jgi:ferritin-like metal-binding protein YciE
VIPVPTRSCLLAAVDLNPRLDPVFDLIQQPPRLPLLPRLGRRTVQLSALRYLPRVQVKSQFDHFRLGFCLTVISLALSIVFHRVDSVAAGVAACRLMSSTMGLFFSPTFETLRDLYVNELRDLYSAETQLLGALPKMADAATSSQLKEAFRAHLEETESHVTRLEEIFDALGEEPSGETCKAMEGLIAEGEDYVKASGDRDVRDAGLIGAAQRVEHYEIGGYGTARTLATRLGESEAADKLQATLDEEGEADRKLTMIAESEVNPEAAATSRKAR